MSLTANYCIDNQVFTKLVRMKFVSFVYFIFIYASFLFYFSFFMASISLNSVEKYTHLYHDVGHKNQAHTTKGPLHDGLLPSSKRNCTSKHL